MNSSPLHPTRRSLIQKLLAALACVFCWRPKGARAKADSESRKPADSDLLRIHFQRALEGIADMPEYDQDDAHRLRNRARIALLPHRMDHCTLRTLSQDDLIETAWALIANAGGGDWDRESPEWREAAAKWRDRFHAQLPQSDQLSMAS